MDSINLIGEEIGFQSDKNRKLVKLIKLDSEEDRIRLLNKELETLLKENNNLKQTYHNIIPKDNIKKFTIGNEM